MVRPLLALAEPPEVAPGVVAQGDGAVLEIVEEFEGQLRIALADRGGFGKLERVQRTQVEFFVGFEVRRRLAALDQLVCPQVCQCGHVARVPVGADAFGVGLLFGFAGQLRLRVLLFHGFAHVGIGRGQHAHDRDHTEDGHQGEDADRRVSPGPFEPAHGRRLGPGEDCLAALESTQIVGESLGAGVALERIFGQALQADGLEVARQFRTQPARRDRVVVDHLEDGVERGVAFERGPARQHFIKDRAEGVDVGQRRDLRRAPAGLLRRDVTRRAHDGAGLGRPAAESFVESFGKPEVGDLRRRFRTPNARLRRRSTRRGFFGSPIDGAAQQHIRRFQIAVDDAERVGVVHRAGEVFDQPGAVAHRHQVDQRRELLGQAAPFDILQRQVGLPGLLADLVDLHDAGVLERRHRRGFFAEALAVHVAGVGPREDHLEGDDAVQCRLAGLVDDPHAAAAEFAQDFESGHDGQDDDPTLRPRRRVGRGIARLDGGADGIEMKGGRVGARGVEIARDAVRFGAGRRERDGLPAAGADHERIGVEGDLPGVEAANAPVRPPHRHPRSQKAWRVLSARG